MITNDRRGIHGVDVDAIAATVTSLTAEPGVYNVVDDDPRPVAEWLPAFARWVDAPEPPRVNIKEALKTAGEDAVYYHTKLTGASNSRAKALLGFAPRPLLWKDKRYAAGSRHADGT